MTQFEARTAPKSLGMSNLDGRKSEITRPSHGRKHACLRVKIKMRAFGSFASIALLGAGLLPLATAGAQGPTNPLTVAGAVKSLKPGEFIWAPQVAPEGPMLIVISLQRQLAFVYRNGVVIGVSTVSTGTPGRETPTGIFTVLQKDIDHKSNLYSNAPMPFMQRLTWGGIALHAGKLPGFPASHGCVRLPTGFAKLLYRVTARGMTVVITKDAPVPRVAPSPDLLAPSGAPSTLSTTVKWQPELAPTGLISIIISTSDHRLVVLRNAKQIGSAPISLGHPVLKPAAYLLQAIDEKGPHWLSVPLPWDNSAVAITVQPSPEKSITIDPGFRASVVKLLEPGTTVVVTPDSLDAGSTGAPLVILSDGD